MDIPAYLNAVTALFVMIDPVGAALVFHSLIPVDEARYRNAMALKSIIIAASLLIIFGNYGQPFLHQLGISIFALRISGGLLLFYTAFNMITQDVELPLHTVRRDISVFPMAIPLLAGPGALTLSILLFSQKPGASNTLAVLAAVITVCLFTLLLMLASRYLKGVVGNTGDEIFRRFLGVILAALAIQFIFDGIVGLAS